MLKLVLMLCTAWWVVVVVVACGCCQQTNDGLPRYQITRIGYIGSTPLYTTEIDGVKHYVSNSYGGNYVIGPEVKEKAEKDLLVNQR